MLYLGCAVWAFRDWVGEFYPAGARSQDFLKLYSDRLTAVEGNTTFYSIPDGRTVDRWAAQTPETFRFCPKLPRLYTHHGALMPHVPAALDFLTLMERLGPRLGPIFVQLPPSYSPARFTDLADFLTAWPQERAAIAVEVRHLDWFQPPHAEALNGLLTRLGVGRVLLDTRPIYDDLEPAEVDPQLASERRKPKVPLQPVVTAPFALVRYISHPDLPRNERFFETWVPRLSTWLQQGTAVYLFIHCPDEARSPAIAHHVYTRLQAAGAAVSPLPWLSLAQPPAQLTLF